MNSRPTVLVMVLGIVGVVALFVTAALLPPFTTAVLLMVLVLAAFIVLALRAGRDE